MAMQRQPCVGQMARPPACRILDTCPSWSAPMVAIVATQHQKTRPSGRREPATWHSRQRREDFPVREGGRSSRGSGPSQGGHRHHATAAGKTKFAAGAKKIEPPRDLTHTRFMNNHVAIVIRGGYRAFRLTAVPPISKMRQGLNHARAG